MGNIDETWYVGSDGHKYYPYMVCRHRMRIPLFHICSYWLIKVKYPEFCMGYIDETWYVCSDGHKYYPCQCGLSSSNAHLIPHLHICSDWLITKKSNIQSSVSMGYIDETWFVGSDGHKYYTARFRTL